MIVRLALLSLALFCGLAAPVAAQVDIGVLRAAIEDGKFGVSDDQTLAAKPTVDLSATNGTALSLYARDPIAIDRDRLWMLFTLRTGPSSDNAAVLNALSNDDPVSFILTFAATENSYNPDALPAVRTSPNLSPNKYALNCLVLRLPYEAPASDIPLGWTFTPLNDEGKVGCGGNSGVDGGRWLTWTAGNVQIPLLAMGDDAELAGLISRYSVSLDSRGSSGDIIEEQRTVTPDTIAESVSDDDEQAAQATRVDGITDNSPNISLSDVDGARYSGVQISGLSGRRIREIGLAEDGGTEFDVLRPLSQDEYRSGSPGYWESGIATGDFILRLPGDAAWSQALVIPENRFMSCDLAAIVPSTDAFGASIGSVRCDRGRLPVTVAVDTGFILKESSYLKAGPCGEDGNLVDVGAPSHHYCALVDESDRRVTAEVFGVELEGPEARKLVEILSGDIHDLAQAALASGGDRRIVNLTPKVRIKKRTFDISLLGDSVTTEFVSNGIRVASGNVGRVVEPMIVQDDPPLLRVSLEFEIAPSLQNALNTLSRGEVTIHASAARDDLELLMATGEKRERVPIKIDLQTGPPRAGYNVLRVAVPSIRLPATLNLEGRLIGYDTPVRNYSCRIGLRIGASLVNWLEADGEQAALPTELIDQEFDLDQVIDILTGPIENGAQDNTVNCLPEETLIAQFTVRDFPSQISVPFARPVIVYWLRTGTADNFYVSESIIPANDIYSSWMENVYSNLNGRRIFAIRKPVNGGGFRTIQSPSSQTNPAKMRMGVRQLVENQESEIFGDVDLRQVFLDARNQAQELGLGDLGDIDIVVLSSESRRSRRLGDEGDCNSFVQESRELPYGAQIVLLRDVRDGINPLSAEGPYLIDTCSQSNGLGQSFSVVLVETKAVASEDRSDLAEFAEALDSALDQLLE
ncbi:hypothetical protein [uncultured Tateyamaria sp.]|uniref:hypothetical protein n=1 Tax=uncultured Tateyamaria sp. TaxID=455651 RepID=UPI002621E72F|nr:hypothetical protein [uncultured Tateyamaria sp.]